MTIILGWVLMKFKTSVRIRIKENETQVDYNLHLGSINNSILLVFKDLIKVRALTEDIALIHLQIGHRFVNRFNSV